MGKITPRCPAEWFGNGKRALGPYAPQRAHAMILHLRDNFAHGDFTYNEYKRAYRICDTFTKRKAWPLVEQPEEPTMQDVGRVYAECLRTKSARMQAWVAASAITSASVADAISLLKDNGYVIYKPV